MSSSDKVRANAGMSLGYPRGRIRRLHPVLRQCEQNLVRVMPRVPAVVMRRRRHAAIGQPAGPVRLAFQVAAVTGGAMDVVHALARGDARRFAQVGGWANARCAVVQNSTNQRTDDDRSGDGDPRLHCSPIMAQSLCAGNISQQPDCHRRKHEPLRERRDANASQRRHQRVIRPAGGDIYVAPFAIRGIRNAQR